MAAAFPALLLLAGCGSTGGWGQSRIPGWVTDPAGIEASYPKQRYITGAGVCGAPNSRDVMSRQQAEAAAVADIASLVEVAIDDTIEEQDTSVERNGRLLTQNVRIQTTRRVVTGLLSGVEIKEAYFDERALNWHALAVLDRRQAGRGALEAIAQRIRKGRAVLASEGHGPAQRYLVLRGLDTMLEEMDRLAVAVALFAPAEQAGARSDIEAFRARWVLRSQAAEAGAAVRIVLEGDGILPDTLTRAAARAARDAGLRITTTPEAAHIRVAVEVNVDTQVGSMRVYNVSSGARVSLVEEGAILAEGRVRANAKTLSRSTSESISRQRSLAKLSERLEPAIAEMLTAAMQPRLEDEHGGE